MPSAQQPQKPKPAVKPRSDNARKKPGEEAAEHDEHMQRRAINLWQLREDEHEVAEHHDLQCEPSPLSENPHACSHV